MNELEKLRERKAQIEDQVDKAWFKHKLKREPTRYQVDWPDAGKWNALSEIYSDIIEERKIISIEIAELEQQEAERKITEIWND